MDRKAAIERLRADLADAASARDWDRLGAATRALGAQVPALAARGPWSAAERQALARLRAAHDQAARSCAVEVEALERRLAEMRSNKEGWIAYALAGEHEPA